LASESYRVGQMRHTHADAMALSPVLPFESSHSTETFYETNAREYFDRTVLVDLRPLYDRVLPRVSPGGRILDVGCGSGRDLKVFRLRGFDAIGIDASSALVKLASSLSGVTCMCMRFEDVEFEKRFDAVWACASLLHLPKDKIRPVLSRLYRALIPGGVMFASVQYGEGEIVMSDGRFFAYYTPPEFAALFEETSFSLDEVWISEDSLPDRAAVRWVNVIARRNTP
jgi:SAM-dependent methyltransferase